MTESQPLPRTGRWELIRALGAVCDTPSVASVATGALGLGQVASCDHTQVFVLSCPPYAAIHLGAEGKLGGEGANRVAGFWRALSLAPPTEPDHLSSLLGLYANLGEAADTAERPTTKSALTHMRHALLWEHLWSWVPGYTAAVADLAIPVLSPWADLTGAVLLAELTEGVAGVDNQLPLALREAPAPLSIDDDADAVLDALVAPLRSGIVITRATLIRATSEIGLGHRIGERRYALRAMFEQDLVSTLTWMAEEARRWGDRNRTPTPKGHYDRTSRWWSARARHNSIVLAQLAAVPSSSPSTTADIDDPALRQVSVTG